MSVMTFSRVGVAAAAMSGLALLAAAPAHAETGTLSYVCDYVGIKIPITASFDSAIEDGATLPTGDVDVNPLTGKVNIAEAQVGLIKFLGATSIAGTGVLDSGVAETGQPVPVDFSFPATTVPASGGMTIPVTGSAEDAIDASEEGAYGFFAGDADLELTTNSGQKLALSCTLAEDTTEEAALIDGFDAEKPKPSPTPTPTTSTPAPTTPAPTTSPSPVRPEIVQTDAAQPTSPTWLPFAGLGAGAVLLGGGLVVTRRSAARH
ncbi:hypothetical protein N802_09170 [Knoellia sinensis KCTC 19936]|uniref:Peptidase n=1 Tax=Knoellia sinensis KCTC 19936 TaxID=1385520 RepID=A0A0A0JDC0_9MICO|nr:hypothetical protein [Knoellia sinensis]KGN33992.1 hypothetical protein N802_09170 [Knoellia sinensis KCTC 19936]